MQTTIKFLLFATALLVANSVFAEEAAVVAPASAGVVTTVLPPQKSNFWQDFAFSVGVGGYRTDEVYGTSLGYTIGLGRRVGDGVVLLRYNAHTNKNPFGEMLDVFACDYLTTTDNCKVKSIDYDELGLMYRQKFQIFTFGLGVGAVKRTAIVERLVEVSPHNYTNEGESSDSSVRAALFYELMFHIPVNTKQKLSIGLGIQGQHNKDYPTWGYMLTFQKGL